MITMVLGGLWHGAAWTFVIWGAYHGAGQVIGHWRRKRRMARGQPALLDDAWSVAGQRLITFNLVCLGWVFFRADSLHSAWVLLGRLFSAFGPAPLVTPLVLLAVAVGIGAQYLPKRVPEWVEAGLSRLRPAVQGVVLGVTLRS